MKVVVENYKCTGHISPPIPLPVGWDGYWSSRKQQQRRKRVTASTRVYENGTVQYKYGVLVVLSISLRYIAYIHMYIYFVIGGIYATALTAFEINLVSNKLNMASIFTYSNIKHFHFN